MKLRRSLATISRWGARLSAPVAVLLMFVYLYLGMGFGLSSRMTDPWLILVHAAPMVVVSLGYLLAYWKERAGALLALLGFLGLLVSTNYFAGGEASLQSLGAWAFLLVPITLFLASWFLRRVDAPKG